MGPYTMGGAAVRLGWRLPTGSGPGLAALALAGLAGCTRPNPVYSADADTTAGDGNPTGTSPADTTITPPDPGSGGADQGVTTRGPEPDGSTGTTMPVVDTGIDPTGEPTGDPTGDPLPSNSCCEVVETPGCMDPMVQSCVCAQDMFCCDNNWDHICVLEATQQCGIHCGSSCCGALDAPCGDPAIVTCLCEANAIDTCCSTDWTVECGALAVELCAACPSIGPCCDAHPGPGCENPEIVACVCTFDAFCCDTTWDMLCVEGATNQCGACVA